MNSFISWIGGKKLLRNIICDNFPNTEFEKYIEVFGGAAWVLFNKEKHAEMEIYNDINDNLVNLFRCVKYHPNAIKDELKYELNARNTFNRFKNIYDLDGFTDIQKAAMFMYLIKLSYGSKGETFGVNNRNFFNLSFLDDIKERLSNVIIENLNYDTIINKYDKENVLFYCDPPYFLAERVYNKAKYFSNEDHLKLNEVLKNIKGKFILSYNDNDFIRQLYKGFNIVETERQNNLTNKYYTKYKELIIKNY